MGIQDEINFPGYPTLYRENGMICTKTALYGGNVLIQCQTDPNPPAPPKADPNPTKWYSAREMMKWYEERLNWIEAANIC